MADKQEPNAPPRPAEASAGVSANICGSAHQREANAEAAADRDNANFQVSVRCEIPTLGTPYLVNVLYDKFYFPTDLCVDWNILHGAPIPSFAFTAAHSRAGETMQYEKVSNVFKRFTFPPTADFSLLSFLHQSPTRAASYIRFLTSLQEAFSQRVEDLESVATKWHGWIQILLFLGFTAVVCGLPALITTAVSFCNTERLDEQKSSQNGDEQTGASCLRKSGLIIGAVLTLIGLVSLVCGAVIACKRQRVFLQELEKKSSLILCGQGRYESANSQTLLALCGMQRPQQLAQQQQQQQVRAWHAEVSFEAGAETFSVSANFTISWKACNEQCAQHRACGPLVEVLVNRSTQNSTGPQLEGQ